MKIFQDVNDIRRLDKHVQEFQKLFLKDIKEHDPQHIKRHAYEFEREVHEELIKLIDLTKEDLKLYHKVFKSLQDFKKTMAKIGHKGKEYQKIADAELRYAELITHSIDQKLTSLDKTFKRLRD